MKLIFVCSGNTCRSPLALAAWRECERERPELREIEASSAGLCPDEGAPAARFARELAREWGENLDLHEARFFTRDDAQSDLILTLTHDQAEVLREHFSLDQSRVRVLGSFVPKETHQSARSQLAPLWGAEAASFSEAGDDILDPFGGSLEAYTECAAQIRRAVRELALFLTREGAPETL